MNTTVFLIISASSRAKFQLTGAIIRVCQMLSWWTKNSYHSINIRDIVRQVVPRYSVHQAPTYEPNLTLLAPLSAMLAHFSMLFILELACTAGSAGQLKNK